MEHEKTVVTSPEYTRAIQLDKSIKAHALIAQESLYEVCKGLKELRDGKLYQELGYQNFEDYCRNEVGFSRMQVYKYISVAENLSCDFVNSSLQIGIQKLALLAKLDEPARQEVMQTVDVESATVKDLNATIKKQKAKIKELEESAEQQKAENEGLQELVTDLEIQVNELENRPIEVAVQEIPDSREVQNLRQAMEKNSHEWAEKYDALQEESLKKENELRRELEKAKRESKHGQNGQSNSVACLALAQSAHDAVSRLKRFMEGHQGVSLYSANYFKTVIERLVDIEAEQVEKRDLS